VISVILMAFSYDPIYIGPGRTIYIQMALIRIEDLTAMERIDPPPIRAVRGPQVKKRKVEGCRSNSTGLNFNHCSGCGSPYHNKANKYCIRNREKVLGGRPDDFNIK
jgi:hypothetical protein